MRTRHASLILGVQRRDKRVIQYAQAPIAPGSKRCIRLGNGGSISRVDGVTLGGGDISFLMDLQPEALGRHPALRVKDGRRSIAVDLERTASSVAAII